jgi:hypothetical protein
MIFQDDDADQDSSGDEYEATTAEENKQQNRQMKVEYPEAPRDFDK